MSWLALSGCVSITGNLPVRRGVPVTAIEVAQGSNVLWRIETASPRPQTDLRYGVVPPGFTQVTPVAHVPRALVPGEELVLRYAYADGRVELQAVAISPTGVQSTTPAPAAPSN